MQRSLSGSDLIQLKAVTTGASGGHQRFVNDLGGGLYLTGLGVQGIGYGASFLTGGISLGLLPVGEGLSTVGTGITVTNDALINKDYTGAALSVTSTVGFGVLGKMVGKLGEAGEITGVQKIIAGALVTTAGALTDKGIDQSKDSKKEEAAKPSLPKEPAPTVVQDATYVNPIKRPINE